MNWNQTSSYDVPGMVVYDPEESAPYLGGPNEEGWSMYPKKQGLGWSGENVSLLQFTSGQEWSSAQLHTSDYLTINLGDPIIKLPAYNVHPVTGFDQTLGEPVYLGTTSVAGMTFRDINSDGTKDLIAFHDDGTVGTRLERGDGSVLDVGDLLSVSDAQDGMIRSGDFV